MYICGTQKFITMTYTDGITVTTLNNSHIAIIDLDKHGKALQSFLKKNSIDEDDAFEKEWENGISSEEVKKRVINRLKKLEWQK